MLTLADIQTRDLLYYDETLSDRCYTFCRSCDIDCLPSLDDAGTFYLRDDDARAFKAHQVTPDRSVDAALEIFHPSLLARFAKHPLLFVVAHQTLVGVVHFSDYNKDAVNIALYALIAEYERSLRALLVDHGCGNAELVAYRNRAQGAGGKQQGVQRKQAQKQKTLDKLALTPPFQDAFLRELIGFAAHHNVIQLDPQVNKLRNKIMHMHDTVHKRDPQAQDYIYTFDSFKEFFGEVQTLRRELRTIKNRRALLRQPGPDQPPSANAGVS